MTCCRCWRFMASCTCRTASARAAPWRDAAFAHGAHAPRQLCGFGNWWPAATWPVIPNLTRWPCLRRDRERHHRRRASRPGSGRAIAHALQQAWALDCQGRAHHQPRDPAVLAAERCGFDRHDKTAFVARPPARVLESIALVRPGRHHQRIDQLGLLSRLLNSKPPWRASLWGLDHHGLQSSGRYAGQSGRYAWTERGLGLGLAVGGFDQGRPRGAGTALSNLLPAFAGRGRCGVQCCVGRCRALLRSARLVLPEVVARSASGLLWT